MQINELECNLGLAASSQTMQDITALFFRTTLCKKPCLKLSQNILTTREYSSRRRRVKESAISCRHGNRFCLGCRQQFADLGLDIGKLSWLGLQQYQFI
jgi:predicted metal-binding membrane protein